MSKQTDIYNEEGEALTQATTELAQIDSMFGALPTEYNREALIQRIHFVNEMGAKCWLQSGRILILMKEHETRHGNWKATLDDIGIGERLARQQMQGAVRFGTPKLQDMAQKLGITKAMELIVLEDDDLEALADGETVLGLTLDETDRMSSRELRTEVRKLKKAKADDANATDQLLSDKNKKIDDLTRQLNEVTSLNGKVNNHTELYNAFCEDISRAKEAIIMSTVHMQKIMIALHDSLSQLPEETHDLMAKFATNSVSEATHAVGKLQYESSLYFDPLLNATPTYQIDSVES